jgi:hypothetical protein
MLRAAVMGTDKPQPDDKYDELVERLHAPGRNFHQRRARQTLLVGRRQNPKEEPGAFPAPAGILRGIDETFILRPSDSHGIYMI